MILRMRSASYVRGSDAIVPPVDIDVAAGERIARVCSSNPEASTLAMMASGLARATSGSVLIGEFDPKIQPVHCKRIAAFVPHDPLTLDRRELDHYIAYRAALWNIDVHQARARASLLLERLTGMHEAFAYPIVGALIGLPQLLVLDRPQPAHVKQLLEAASACAIFSTHIDAGAAEPFSIARAVEHA